MVGAPWPTAARPVVLPVPVLCRLSLLQVLVMSWPAVGLVG